VQQAGGAIQLTGETCTGCAWDHTYPTLIHTPFQDLVAIVSVQEELNQTNENSGSGK